MSINITDYKEPSPYRNLIITLVLLIVGSVFLFRFYQFGKSKTHKGVLRKNPNITKKDSKKESLESGNADFAKVSSALEKNIPDFKFFSVEKKETIGTALRYRQMKESLNSDDSDAEEKRRKRNYLDNGGKLLTSSEKLLKEGKSEQALGMIKQAMEQGSKNPEVMKEAYLKMAYHYQGKEDMPRYCMNMYNYLEIVEKNPEANQSMDEVQELKDHFKNALEKMKERGLLH